VKLDAAPPDGKRYRSPSGRPNRLYIPPLLDHTVLTEVRTPLWLTEGEKKALKACQEGLACIAVPGVWSWRTRDARDQSVAIQDLEHINWSGRTVFVVYDSDVATNPKVRLAEYALAKELQRRGATVKAIRLPGGSGTEKVGLDDYLLTHSVEALCELEPVDLLDTSGEPGTADPPEGDLRREGLDLALVWPNGIRCTLSTIRDSRDGVKGQLTVARGGRRVGWGTWTLSSLHSRREIQKELDEAATGTIWTSYLKEAAWRFTQAVREGEPVVTLQGQTTAGPEMLLPGWLYAGEPTLLYADGDTGKSLTALTIAVAMHAGVALPGGLAPTRETPAAYLDWETTSATIDQRLGMVAAGLGIKPPGVLYKRMTRPLVDEIGTLSAELSRRKVGFVVVDSQVFAMAAGEGAAFHEPMTQFYGALRLFAPAAVLVVSHVTNADARSGVPARPFGGAFAFNGPRVIWEAKRDQDVDDATAIVFTCRKANILSRKPAPFGLQFQSSSDRAIAVSTFDLRDAAPQTVAGASLPHRLKRALAEEAQSVEALAKVLGVSTDTIRRTLNRGRDAGTFVPLEDSKPQLWAVGIRG
jgi:hypothetical protein